MKKLLYTLIVYVIFYSATSFAIGTWPTPEYVATTPWWTFFVSGWF